MTSSWAFVPSAEINLLQPIFAERLKTLSSYILPKAPEASNSINSELIPSIIRSEPIRATPNGVLKTAINNKLELAKPHPKPSTIHVSPTTEMSAARPPKGLDTNIAPAAADAMARFELQLHDKLMKSTAIMEKHNHRRNQPPDDDGEVDFIYYIRMKWTDP